MQYEYYRGFLLKYNEGYIYIIKNNIIEKKIDCSSFHNGKGSAKYEVDKMIKSMN